MSVISMKQLLEAGVHFGHQTRRWNPKMAPYIYTERNGIYIIDLQKSVGKVDEAYKAMADIAADGGTILFVGTKKQAQDAIKVEAERCGMSVSYTHLDVYKRQHVDSTEMQYHQKRMSTVLLKMLTKKDTLRQDR